MSSTLEADPRYWNAIDLFNRQEWYAAHDAFEELWHESAGAQRSFLQGIIQVAVAEHHLENGNRRGSLLLMAEGLRHLNETSSLSVGFDQQFLGHSVSQRLAALQTDAVLTGLPVPSCQNLTIPQA